MQKSGVFVLAPMSAAFGEFDEQLSQHPNRQDRRHRGCDPANQTGGDDALEWLDFNMHQTGHGLVEKTMSWDRISKDYQRTP